MQFSWFDGLESPMELAQRLLSEGKADAAIEQLRLLDLDLDGHLLMAEALWTQAGPCGTRDALQHYEAAAGLAQAANDVSKEAAVALGHSWALLQLKDPEAPNSLKRARALAEKDGNAAAIQFVDSFLENSNVAGEDTAKVTWTAFVQAYVTQRPVLFLRGSINEPEDELSVRGVAKLKEAGVKAMKAVNVNESGPDLPGGLQTLATLGVELPQLYLDGKLVENWLEMEVPHLRDLLVSSGATMDAGEPCHGVFSEGLEGWQVKLVDMVSKTGAEDWEAKASELQGSEAPKTGEALREAWLQLAPIVKDKLETQPEMPCGHSCNTCPSKHDCHLHEAVGHVRDIEDLI